MDKEINQPGDLLLSSQNDAWSVVFDCLICGSKVWLEIKLEPFVLNNRDGRIQLVLDRPINEA